MRRNEGFKPEQEIVEAFGEKGIPQKIIGGQGENYRVSNIVLKPGKDNEETNWIAEFYKSVKSEKFRLPRPIKATNNKYVFDGWQAWKFLQGKHDNKSWDKIIKLCYEFHREISHKSKPEYFERREKNPWVIADKAAFFEIKIAFHPEISREVAKLQKLIKPVTMKNQLIHGDFGGNVLFSRYDVPAVIDFSPYWRPVEFAVGVVVADAIVWEGAGFNLMDKYFYDQRMLQFLIRAELRRIIELNTLFDIYGWNVLNQIAAHRMFIDELVKRIQKKVQRI